MIIILYVAFRSEYHFGGGDNGKCHLIKTISIFNHLAKSIVSVMGDLFFCKKDHKNRLNVKRAS